MLYFYDDKNDVLTDKPAPDCSYGYPYTASEGSGKSPVQTHNDSLEDHAAATGNADNSKNGETGAAGGMQSDAVSEQDSCDKECIAGITSKKVSSKLPPFEPYDLFIIELYTGFLIKRSSKLTSFLQHKLGFTEYEADAGASDKDSTSLPNKTKNKKQKKKEYKKTLVYEFRLSSGRIVISASNNSIYGIAVSYRLKDETVIIPLSAGGIRYMLTKLYADAAGLDPKSIDAGKRTLNKAKRLFIEKTRPDFDLYPPVFLSMKEKQRFIPDISDEKDIKNCSNTSSDATLFFTQHPALKKICRVCTLISAVIGILAVAVTAGDFMRYFSGEPLSVPSLRSRFSQLIKASAEPKLQVEFCIFYEGWENIDKCSTGHKAEGKLQGKWDFTISNERYSRIFPAVEKIEVKSGTIRVKARDTDELEGVDLIIEPVRDRYNQPEWKISPQSGCIRKKLC